MTQHKSEHAGLGALKCVTSYSGSDPGYTHISLRPYTTKRPFNPQSICLLHAPSRRGESSRRKTSAASCRNGVILQQETTPFLFATRSLVLWRSRIQPTCLHTMRRTCTLKQSRLRLTLANLTTPLLTLPVPAPRRRRRVLIYRPQIDLAHLSLTTFRVTSWPRTLSRLQL